MMYRNNGQKKAVRLIALRDYIYGHADQKHAVKIEDIIYPVEFQYQRILRYYVRLDDSF